MKLYGYWRSSASYRVRIALHWKGLAFENVPVSLLRGEQRREEYLHVNPQGLVPTLVEQGIAGFEVNTWGGLVAPKGTSPEIVARLNGELIRILSNPDIKQTRLLQGFEFAPPLSPTAFAELISSDLARWVPLLKTTGVRAD